MMQFHAIALLIAHGLITGAQSSPLLSGDARGIANPGFVQWWFTRLGESWLLSRLGLEFRPILFLFGFLWLTAGIGFVAAALGLAGWLVPPAWYHTLAVGSTAISLLLFILFFHPLYLLGVLVNVHVYMAGMKGAEL